MLLNYMLDVYLLCKQPGLIPVSVTRNTLEYCCYSSMDFSQQYVAGIHLHTWEKRQSGVKFPV